MHTERGPWGGVSVSASQPPIDCDLRLRSKRFRNRPMIDCLGGRIAPH